MTDKQPEAIEVADDIEGYSCCTLGPKMDKAAALLRTQHAEIERLNSCLKWEQNRADHIGTHQPGCETWGPRHYECALRAIERKDALLSRCLDAFETDDWMKKLTAAGEIRKELSQ